jgi:hypothetical protein
MTKRSVVVGLVLALLSGVLAQGALAVPPEGLGRPEPWIGERINVLVGAINEEAEGPTEFPADTPFHVRHGWLIPLGTGGNFYFWLEIDGVDQGKGIKYQQLVSSNGDTEQLVFDVFNYPSGLPEGTYIFTGHWVGPCDSVLGPAECGSPSEPAEHVFSHAVIFTP